MKKFILIILSFLIPIFGFLWLVQVRVDQAGRHRVSQMNLAQQSGIDADVVIFGNSRAQCSYNTEIMDSILGVSCFNMGLNGKPFDYQYHFIIRPYLRNNRCPSLIVQEVSPQAFFRHYTPKFDYQFLPFLGCPDYAYYIQTCDEVSTLDKFLPIKYRGIKFPKLYRMYCGWRADTIRSYRDGYTPRSMVKQYTNNFQEIPLPLEHDADKIAQFSEYLAVCDSMQIPVVLVVSPMHIDDFYNLCDMEGFYRLIDSLSSPYDIPLLDYSHLFGNDTTLMIETTHMSYEGSCAFSKKFSLDIKHLFSL